LIGPIFIKRGAIKMQCPICKAKIPGLICERCGEETPENARYCMHCGNPLTEEGVGSVDVDTEDEFDIENRVLCPDGTCTGIIVNGRCTECGKEYNPESNSEGWKE